MIEYLHHDPAAGDVLKLLKGRTAVLLEKYFKEN